MTREEIKRYIATCYAAEPEYLWLRYPSYAVFRHRENRKWFAVLMRIRRETLGLSGEGEIDIINLKCDPLLVSSLLREEGFFPAYHMNKTNWISVCPEQEGGEERLQWLLDMSFCLTQPKQTKTNNHK